MKLLESTLSLHSIEAPRRFRAATMTPEPPVVVVHSSRIFGCEVAGCGLRAVYLCTEEETFGDTSCAAHAMPCCSPIVNPEATHAR